MALANDGTARFTLSEALVVTVGDGRARTGCVPIVYRSTGSSRRSPGVGSRLTMTLMTAHPDVFDAALTLPADQRAALAHQLLASLDEPADDPAVVASEWASEIGRRVSGIVTGDTIGVSSDEAREQLGR